MPTRDRPDGINHQFYSEEDDAFHSLPRLDLVAAVTAELLDFFGHGHVTELSLSQYEVAHIAGGIVHRLGVPLVIDQTSDGDKR